MRILSIDPGFERLGVAILEETSGKTSLLYSECFHTKKDLPFHERLTLIGKRIQELIKTYSPSALAIETLAFNTNKKTALLVSETRGVILYESFVNNLEIYEYTPPQIKTAVAGYGKASKEQVFFMAQKLLQIDKIISKDDEMDAIAVGLTCLASHKLQSIKSHHKHIK